MTFISWSSDFALYFEDYFGWTSLFGIMRQCDAMTDLIIIVSHSDLYCPVIFASLCSSEVQ